MVVACSWFDRGGDGIGGVGAKRISSQRKCVSQMVVACSRVDGGGMRWGGGSVVRGRVYHRWWWPLAGLVIDPDRVILTPVLEGEGRPLMKGRGIFMSDGCREFSLSR